MKRIIPLGSRNNSPLGSLGDGPLRNQQSRLRFQTSFLTMRAAPDQLTVEYVSSLITSRKNVGDFPRDFLEGTAASSVIYSKKYLFVKLLKK